MKVLHTVFRTCNLIAGIVYFWLCFQVASFILWEPDIKAPTTPDVLLYGCQVAAYLPISTMCSLFSIFVGVVGITKFRRVRVFCILSLLSIIGVLTGAFQMIRFIG